MLKYLAGSVSEWGESYTEELVQSRELLNLVNLVNLVFAVMTCVALTENNLRKSYGNLALAGSL